MIYYNKNNEKVIIPDEILNNVISHGECGTVYRLSNDLCLKNMIELSLLKILELIKK